MIQKIRVVLVAAGALVLMVARAQSPQWAEPPRLVVGIVVDQMRTDYLYRYWDNFGEGGFKRMVAEGSFQRDAHYDHVPTITGAGHAGIYTGTTPARHGIVANDMYVRSTKSTIYCVEDRNVKGVGCEGPIGQRSPLNLLATTLADELERRTDGRSKTIGIALKDRSAILPMGRTGDAAFWFAAGTDGAFASSTWYFDSLPQWVTDFNGERLAASYLGRTWEPLLALDRYHAPLPDDNPYEVPLPGATSPTLPQDLQALFKASGNTSLIRYTPWGNTLTTDLALAALVGEDLGTDAVPDLLAISYSSPDELAHRVGPRALEIEDMYVRLDQEIARLFAELDRRMGKGKYTVFLTADHGGADVSAYLADLKGSAGYSDNAKLESELEAALTKLLGPGKWVRRVMNDQVFLNDSLIAVRKLEPQQVQRFVADRLLGDPTIAEALTATDLVREGHAEGMRRSLSRGFMPSRSGDVLYSYRPGIAEPYSLSIPNKGTEHSTGWNYDTHVPVLFMGRGVVKGEVVRRTSVTDLAPTVSMILGMTMPDASDGQVVPEVVAR